MTGTIFGSLGIISTSFYQIWVKSEQERLGLSAQQLLHNQARLSFFMLILVAPFLDDVWTTEDSLFQMKWATVDIIGMVLLSASLAFVVNLSIFLVIGKTSPLSYNVLGHAKLCCVLVSGYIIFGEIATMKNIIGVCMAVIGIMWYTHLRVIANQNVSKKI